MKELLKGEIKTQFNKKTILILLGVIIFAMTSSLIKYDKYYSNLFNNQLKKTQEYSKKAYDIYIYLDDFSMDIKKQIVEMKTFNIAGENIKAFEEEAKNIEIEKNVILNMQFYYENMTNLFSKSMNEINTNADANFMEALRIGNKINSLVFEKIYKKGIEPKNKAFLYKNKIEDLYKRIVTVQTKIKLNEKANIKATGFSMLDFQMASKIPYSIIILVVLLNYNIWSKEFEHGHIKSLLSQPFKKSEIYFYRFVVSLLKTLIIVAIIFILPVIIAAINNKWGKPVANIINFLVKNRIFDLLPQKEIFLYIEGVDTIEYAGYYLLIFFTYIVFLISIINLVSIIFKSNFASIVVTFIILSLMFLQNYFNPVCYCNIEKLLLGEIGIGFIGAMVIMIAAIIGSNIVSYLLFKRYKNE